jgi:protease-4
MRSFFKTLFAALLALLIFSGFIIFYIVRSVSSITSKERVVVSPSSVLVIDLGKHYMEQEQDNFLSSLGSNEPKVPGLYDLVRMIHHAKDDKNIAGIYLQANPSPNGFEASEEIRLALEDFKSSKKFIVAHGNGITQKTYSIANVADQVYVSPQGGFEWIGYSVEYLFLKGTLDRLDIQPQIFYAGKFKSATEPLRAEKMTPENQLQTTIWLNDLYSDLLVKTALARNIDSASLRALAVEGKIRTPEDALQYKLIDGVKYDDELRDYIKAKVGATKYERINFVTAGDYNTAVDYKSVTGEKIALIYAEGDIVDGKGSKTSIGSETFQTLFRKARLDRSVKAIVFRINSGGGSSLASEHIWREVSLARKDKPVIVSFGDVAASGGYYIATGADSIFAMPTTITGSIGVFGIVPNMEGFFKNKLGVTFDGVKTAPYADLMSITHPMNEDEKKLVQAEIERIYKTFKQRVADGRKRDTAYVDSIAQGRVWTGMRAREIGLIDRFGTLDDAIRSAARMAKLDKYYVKEYPESSGFLSQLLGKVDNSNPLSYAAELKKEIGEEQFTILEQLKKIKDMTGTVQARLPFTFFVR